MPSTLPNTFVFGFLIAFSLLLSLIAWLRLQRTPVTERQERVLLRGRVSIGLVLALGFALLLAAFWSRLNALHTFTGCSFLAGLLGGMAYLGILLWRTLNAPRR